MFGHVMAPVMIRPAALKADFAAMLNRAPGVQPAQIPCSLPGVSLFASIREKHNYLITLKYHVEPASESIEKKYKFPVSAPEQGKSAASPRPANDHRGTPPDARPDSQPNSCQPGYADQARKLCRHGLDEADLADFFEVEPATIDRWRRTHPAFATALARGKADADAQVERSLYRRAIGYDRLVVKVFTPVWAEEPIRVPVREQIPPDVRAAITWLSTRCPDKWGSPRQRVSQNLGKPREAAPSMPLERDQRGDLEAIPAERIGAAELRQVDDELDLAHDRAGLAKQPHRSTGGAAGGDQIVDQQHSSARRAGIFMHRDPVSAIFEGIILGDGGAGQLAVLADQQDAGFEWRRQRRRKEKAACLDPRDKVDRAVRCRGHPLDTGSKTLGIEQ
jgi:hypothetical protein